MQLGNTNAGPLYIGHDEQFRFFDGQIADVRFWDGARSAEDIAANMSHFVPSDAVGLIANWRLDDQAQATGATVDDAAGGFNGTTSGSPVFVTNAAPVYTTDLETTEDVALRGTIDIETNVTATYAISTNAANGTVTINSAGDYIYRPTAEFWGTDSFVVTVTPTDGVHTPATVTIHVTVNEDPTDPYDHHVSGQNVFVIPHSDTIDIVTGSSGNDGIFINGPMESGDTIDMGGGSDTVTLNYGANGNTVYITNVESLLGSTGNDHVSINGTELVSGVALDGGSGTDELIILANSGNLTRTAAQLAGISAFESWRLASGVSYDLTLNDYNVSSGNTLSIDATGMSQNQRLDASAITNGHVNFTGGGGNDVLIGGLYNDILRGGSGNDSLGGGPGADILDGGDGFDQVRYTTASAAVTVNLATGTATIGSTVDTLISIEAVVGTAYADTFAGSDNSLVFEYVDGFEHPTRSMLERFAGLAGNDVINGGAGFDQVDYSLDASFGGASGVTVNLATGTATDGFGNTDTLSNIEFVRGTAGNDTMTGSTTSTTESFVGLAGNDIIDGGTIGSTTNRVYYSQDASFGGMAGVTVNLSTGTATDGFGGTDTLSNINDVSGTASADTITGATLSSTGFQTFAGLGGNDTISGASTVGITQVDYSRDAGAGGLNGVTVNLDSATHNGVASLRALDGFGDTDTLANIRGVRGTNTDDFFFGSNSNGTATERFRGLGGDDYIDGGSGTDEADYSNDASFGGLRGVVVNLSTSSVTVSLNGASVTVASNHALDGFGDTDTLIGIENISGTAFGDILIGNSSANTIGGGVGVDTLTGGAGADTFVSSGGGDLDTITDFSASTDLLNLSSAASAFTYNEALNALVISSTGQGYIFAAGTGLDDVNFNLTNQNSAGGKIMSMVDDTGSLTGGTSGDLLLLAGSTSGKTADGGSGDDRIRDSSGNASSGGANTLTGGAGADTLIGLHGSDTLNLGSSDGAIDTVVYGFTTDGGTSGDTINQFESTDLISFTDVGSANFLTLLDRDGDGTLTNDKRSITGLGSSVDYGTHSVFVISSAVATILTLSSLTLAATAIDLAVGSENNLVAGRKSIFVVTDSVSSQSAMYVYTEDGFSGTTAAELTLLATIDRANLTTANFTSSSNDKTVTGTSANDTIHGGIDNDIFTVTAGSDIYYTGGGGTDRLDFGTGFDMQGVELVGNNLVFTYSTAETDEPLYTATIADHLTSTYALEQVTFDFRDEMRTLDVATTFSGGAFTNDTAFAGTSSADTITGGAGDDILLGNGGNDILLGGGGDDWLVGGAGNDAIDGGSNGGDGDFVSFFSSPAGVIVDLGAGTASDGWGTTDTISNVENVEGSDFNDSITGNSLANNLEGGLGRDTIAGGAGNDRFIYRSEDDSGTTSTTRDWLTDFNAGTNTTHVDQIDISDLVQGTFSYIGTGAFTADGNTHARFESNGDGAGVKLLEIDTDGDATADMQIQLNNNFDSATLDTNDFKHTNS